MGYRVKLPPIKASSEKTIDGSPIPEKVVIPVITGDLSTEPPASPPVTRQERWAELVEEEALFRLYWKTLPDKARARRIWPFDVRHYCRAKGLGLEVLEELERRCQDLLGGKL